jgi:hypothetical protein
MKKLAKTEELAREIAKGAKEGEIYVYVNPKTTRRLYVPPHRNPLCVS